MAKQQQYRSLTRRTSEQLRVSMMMGLLFGSVSMIKTTEQAARDNYQKGKY
jgi:hypothetical protein